MKRIIPIFLILLYACSGPKKFKVTMEADALGTQLLTVVYTLPDGDRAVLQPTAMDGRVEFEGNAVEPSLVEVFANTGASLVQFMALNGEKISITMADGEWQVAGAANSLTDSVADEDGSSLMFVAPAVIVERDSMETFNTEGVWVFTSTQEQRTKALFDTLRHYGKRSRDIYFASGYEEWRSTTRSDSATWRQGFLPYGPVNLPAVTSVPLLLEVDSTGAVLRRQSLVHAVD